MKLLIERVEETKLIVEDSNGSKNYYIQGPFLQGGIKNRNGRIYPNEVLDEKVNDYIDSTVNKNRGWGELGHPLDAHINLDRVSHRITELTKEGNDWYGKARILDTPMGLIARGLMDGGGSLGVSSRGIGSLVEDGDASIVQPDFIICTAADIVADPSAPDAYVQGIMEGKEWLYVDGHFVERQIESAKKRIQKTPSKRLQEQAVKEFEMFLQSLI